MLEQELSMEASIGGNEEVQKLNAFVINLLGQGYTRDEIRKAAAKRFDLSIPVLSNSLETLCAQYTSENQSSVKRM